MSFRTNAALLASVALAGCAVGPRGATLVEAPLPATTGAGAGASVAPIDWPDGTRQDFAVGQITPTRWWHSFGCDRLDTLVETALATNEDIKAADASLRQAHEIAAAAGGTLGPQFDASYQFQRSRISSSLAPPVTDPNQLLYSLHSAQLSMNYPLDIFGTLRSKARSARAAAELQGFRLLAARQTVVANLANAIITRASIENQITASKATIEAERDLLAMLKRRQQLGTVGLADVASQEAALATAESALPALLRSETRQRSIISIFLARPPGENLPALPDMACLRLPQHMPVALPASVIRQRPDVRAAEAQVHGAAADLGAAVAARLPSFALTANVGGEAQDFGRIFTDGNVFWSLINGITAPIFHSGTLRHNQHAAEAALDAAKAQYRATALQAFADISDALTGLHGDALALEAAERGAASAEQSFNFAQREVSLGEIGTFGLLNAEAARQQARLQLIQARAATLTDSVAMFQANGAPENTGD